MRIVHVINSLDRGGAEQVVVDLASWQRDRGHQVRIVTLLPKERARRRLPHDDKSHVDATDSAATSYWRTLPWLWSHRDLLMSADVIHAHLTFGALVGFNVEALRDLRGLTLPVVIETDHSAGMALTRIQQSGYYFLGRRRRVIATVVPGVYTVQPHQRATRLEIPNGIIPLPRRSTWSAGRILTLGSLGRLRADRRPDIYLDVLERLLDKTEVRFVYGGDGPYRDQLVRAIAQRGLSNHVKFYGTVRDKVSFFETIDVHISLAIAGQVGLASLESASTATPSVAVQLQAPHPRLKDPIPSSPRPQDLVELIALLADSAEKRKSLGQSQADFVRRARSVETMAQAYLSAYEAALADASA